MTRVRRVEVLPAIRSSRFDLPLSYEAGVLDLQTGDVVRVPLGTREVLAFVLSPPVDAQTQRPLRAVLARLDVPRAFDADGLALAEFVARTYLCTLGEGLSCVTLGAAVPHSVDLLRRTASPASRNGPQARLLNLIDEVFEGEFALETLLRHREARRIGDRATLLRTIGALTRAGALRRERRFVDAGTKEYRVEVLLPGSGEVRGPKASALVAFVREAPGVPLADALLAGFSRELIRRAAKAGAIALQTRLMARARERVELGPPEFAPSREQREAIARVEGLLDGGAFGEMLLYGVTGSGKTLVYVEAIKSVVRKGARAIVLVPEISLTPQTARRFEAAFGARVAVLHSALSERERFDAWQACARDEIDVLVGARSAVFAPLHGVRLIVVDEAHETSYKQERAPRYQAVEIARERMRRARGVLVLGSATPSLESYDDALAGRIDYAMLRSRPSAAPMPHVHVVDMAAEFESGNRRIFSAVLTQALGARLERGEKSVLFVNRRGSAGFVLCRACGYVPRCTRCSVSLAAHRSEGLLRCHYCDAQEPIPAVCPRCRSGPIREFGVGTERVVEEVTRLFAGARVVRMDADTTTRVGDHARLLDRFASEGDVLVGTQMVAKGLDFPSVTLAAAVAADLGLHYPDFRAGERTFALIAQVCGRSGRTREGEAIVQTYTPDHPAIVLAAAHDYPGFASGELADRAELGFPPSRKLLYVGAIGKDRHAALAAARRYARLMEEAKAGEVLGPAPYPIARLNGEWRYRVALRGDDAEAMRSAVRERVLPAAHADRVTRVAIDTSA